MSLEENDNGSVGSAESNRRPVPFFWTLPSVHAAAIVKELPSNNHSLTIDQCRTIADLVWEYHAPPELFQILNFVKATAPELAGQEEKQEEIAHLVWNFEKHGELKQEVEDQAEDYMDFVRDGVSENELLDGTWMRATMMNLSQQFCKQGSPLFEEILETVTPSMSLKERNDVFRQAVSSHMDSERFEAAEGVIAMSMEKEKDDLTNDYNNESLRLFNDGNWNGLVSLQAIYKAKLVELDFFGFCPDFFIECTLEFDEEFYWDELYYEELAEEEDGEGYDLPDDSDDESSDFDEDSVSDDGSQTSKDTSPDQAKATDQETIAWLQSILSIELFMFGQELDDLYRQHGMHFIGLRRHIGRIHKKVLAELMQNKTKCTCEGCKQDLLVDSLHVVEEQGSFFLVGEGKKESKDVEDFGNALANAFSSQKGLW